MFPFNNPEFIRHARVQLRYRYVVIILPILISLVVMLAVYGIADKGSSHIEWKEVGAAIFIVLTVFNFVIFYFLNSILTLISVSIEKAHKTYDFQLMTRMSPFELMIGKLFGAPVIGYVMMGIFASVAFLCVLITGGVSFKVVLVTYVILITTGVLLNCIALLLSTFFERMWVVIGFIILLLVISPVFQLAFMIGSIGGYGYTSNLDKGISVLNPFETIFNVAQDRPANTNFFGIKTPSSLTQPLFYILLTFMVCFATAYRLKKSFNPFIKHHYLLLMFILQILILAFIWPPVFNTLQGQGGYYAGIEVQYNRLDYLGILAQFLAINMSLILITAISQIRERSDLSIWLRKTGTSLKSVVANFFHSKSLPIYSAAALSISALAIFGLAYSNFSYSTFIENNLTTFYGLCFLFIFFILREIGYFSVMRLTKIGSNLWVSVTFLVLFYIAASVLAGIFTESEAIMYSIFPFVGFIGYNELSGAFAGTFTIVLIETIIIYIALFMGLAKLKRKSIEISKK